jgi:2-oxoisovalerate dehydrogenase E2 component (dihydrolipoyl transacylase)
MGQVRDFLLPDLGEGLESGEIVEWHVGAGDHVDLNQEICDVETAKAVVSIPCPFSGTVVERFGEVGEELEVGQPLIRIDVEEVAADAEAEEIGEAVAGADEMQAVAGGEAGPEGAPEDAAAVGDGESRHNVLVGYGAAEGAPSGRRRRRSGTTVSGNGQRTGTKAKAKPPVRKLAKDLGVDIEAIAPGSGSEGVVTRDDVRAAAGRLEESVETTTAAPDTEVGTAVTGFRGRSPGDVIPVTGIRRRINAKMITSRTEIPEATTEVTVDCTATWELADRLTAAAADEGRDVRITPFAIVARAAVLALRRFPTLNAVLDHEAGEIRLLEPIHLGIATDTDRGLLVPVVRDAHRRSTVDLAAEIVRVVEAARGGSITPGDLTGGTFTVNNYGALGNDRGDPIINHP